MIPRVILSNAVSPNGSLTGFPVDYGVYYPLLLSYKPDAVLVGADTVLAAPVEITPEMESDCHRRPSEPGETRPLWVIVDSRGRLSAILHVFRRMEYVRDIIVLVAETTPPEYIHYLEDRGYLSITAGKDRVDLAAAMEVLSRDHAVRTLVSDTGGTLGTVMLESGLVDELSLVIAPALSGRTDVLLYRPVSRKNIDLVLKCYRDIGEGYVHLVYEVVK